MAEVKITNQILLEAIADADTVRRTAIENAKISLEETFTPHIKSMLSRRLRAEAEGSDEEETDDVETTAPEAEKKEAEPKMEGAKEGAQEKAEPEHSSATPQASSHIGAGDNKEPSAEAEATSDIDQGGEGHTDSETDWYDDWSESDFDLDEVIAELEGELNEMGKETEEEAEEAPESDEDGGKEKTDAMVKHNKEEEKEAVDPHAAADVNKFVAEPATPKMEMGYAKEEMQEAEHEELNLEELLAELEAADAEEAEAHSKMVAELGKVKEELAQYKAALSTVRDRLHEVNLLNAKLLYTNKIFRKDGLTTEQKVSIVENFDRASSVREVKMVYTVLVETLSTAAKTVKATKSPAKIVAEGFASKATPSTAPKTETTEILAENSVAKRLQQLAGII